MVWLLTLYAFFQALTLLTHSAFLLLLYVVLYLAALVVAGKMIVRKVREEGKLKELWKTILLFFLFNLVLFILYVPTLLMNPNINWRLKGEAEVDPMFFLAFFPGVLFCVAVVLLGITGAIAKVFIARRLHRT